MQCFTNTVHPSQGLVDKTTLLITDNLQKNSTNKLIKTTGQLVREHGAWSRRRSPREGTLDEPSCIEETKHR